ncbi:MAG: hypothetical protein C4522_16860 [Desulfobacteraceae bacterium]|nr:MAG: hypothetical protein C4522_16860 [Desulfobacteraceae bacterium]
MRHAADIDFSAPVAVYGTMKQDQAGCLSDHFQNNLTITSMNHPITGYRLFRTIPAPGDNPFGISLADENKEKSPLTSELIVCRQCYHIITRPEEKIQVNGSHQHTFANPSGLIFEIGCFQNAEGCGYTGQATKEYSWFNGYAWRIAVCGKCLTQLGWLFSTSMGITRFNGLILENLIIP